MDPMSKKPPGHDWEVFIR